MNAERREKLDQICIDLAEIVEEEQNAFSELSENVQRGQKGKKMQRTIDAMQSAIDELEGIDA